MLLAGAIVTQSASALQPGETAHLTAQGPVNPQTTFPLWYQDHTGLTLGLQTNNTCLPGLCNNDPPDPADPFQVQTGFGEESFWWSADASLTINPSAECPTCGRGILVMGVEAAYNIAPAPDDQFTFGRIRVRIDAPAAGHYKLTFPFGERFYDVAEPGLKAINVSEDTGTIGSDFTGPLKSGIGAFLIWDPNIAPAAPAGTIGDPAVEHEVIGATFKDPITGQPYNKVRFEYLDGPLDLDGQGNNFIEVNLFSVSGIEFNGVTPTPLSVPRATFTDGRAEVVADSSPDATVTVTFDDATTPVTLVGNGSGSFYTSKAAAEMPHVAHVTSQDPDNGPTTVNAVVKDVVTISAAQYDPAMKTLLVRAASSFAAATPTPTLSAIDFGQIDPATGSLTVTGVPIAPAWVQVNSSLGGSTRLTTLILNESPNGTGGETPPPPPPPPGNQVPVAQNDTASTVIGTPVVINVAGNDIDPDGTLNLASIQIVQPPRCGTIGVIAAAGIEYRPGADFGSLCDIVSPDAFTYAIKDNLGAASNTASVTVTPLAAQITVTQAQFVVSKREWRVRGTSNAVNATIQIFLVKAGTTTEQAISSGVVDPTGAFDVRTTGGPIAAAGDTITVKIGNTTINGIPVVVKN